MKSNREPQRQVYGVFMFFSLNRPPLRASLDHTSIVYVLCDKFGTPFRAGAKEHERRKARKALAKTTPKKLKSKF